MNIAQLMTGEREEKMKIKNWVEGKHTVKNLKRRKNRKKGEGRK